MKRPAFCMLLMLTIAVAVQTQSQPTRPQPTKRLDLTIPSAPPEEPTSMRGSGRGTSKPQPLTLLMTLTKVDTGAYRQRDELQFEVLLENVGNRPVRLPWSRQTSATTAAPDTNLVRGLLFLRFLDAKGTQFQGPGVALAGQATGDTSLLLQPREKAIIAVPATWSSLSPATRKWLEGPSHAPVRVIATFRLTDGETAYRSITSGNQIEISLF